MTAYNEITQPPCPRVIGVPACLGAAMLALTLATAAMAQPLTPAPAAQASPERTASPPDARPPERRPGLLDTLGRWFDSSVDSISAGIKGAKGTIGSIGDTAEEAAKGAASTATGVARDTADTLVRLPGTRMVDGREKCVLAPNGAPDCYAAAEALCRNKGFGGGKSVDIHSAEKCPAQVWLSGRAPRPGECRTETYVTRAVCN